MPRLNAAGRAVMGNGAAVSIDGHVIAPRGTCAQWLDDHTAIYQVERDGRWFLEAYDLATGTDRAVDSRGCNELAAGGGRFVAFLAGVGLFGAITDSAAGVSPTSTDGRGAAGVDGTLACVPNRAAGDRVELVAPNGTVHIIAPAPYGLQVYGPADAIWNGSVPGLLPGAVGPQRVILRDGTVWYAYWTDALGFVAHPKGDPQHGVQIEPRPIAFYPHARLTADGRFLAAYATGQQERPQELVVKDVGRLPRMDLMALLTPPVTPPPPPDPDPDPQPDPEVPVMRLPERIKPIVVALHARHTDLARGDDDQRRAMTWIFAEQIAYELGEKWGTKRADPGRPLSKDAIAYTDGTHLWGADCINGTTREPQFPDEMENITGQVFVAVPPKNHLARPAPDPDPEPEPGPDTDLVARVAKLELQTSALIAANAETQQAAKAATDYLATVRGLLDRYPEPEDVATKGGGVTVKGKLPWVGDVTAKGSIDR